MTSTNTLNRVERACAQLHQDGQQVTFTAAPGTYRFYCAIPGHTALGMAGTLTVR